MNKIDFKPFLDSNIDYCLIVGPHFSGRSFLAEQLIEQYFEKYPEIRKYQKSYVRVFRYGDEIFDQETLEDLGGYSDHDYSSKVDPLPLVFFDLVDEMNIVQERYFKDYIKYPPLNAPHMRFKLIITATKENVIKYNLNSHPHIKIELEEHNMLYDALINRMEVVGLTLLKEEDINHMLLRYMYSYSGFSKKQIDYINAAFILGNGMISEYSFNAGYLKDFGVKSTPEEILDYLQYNDLIYSFYLEDDIPFTRKCVWYKHSSFLAFLREYLQEEINTLGVHLFNAFKGIDFKNKADVFTPPIRLLSLLKCPSEVIAKYFLIYDDENLGIKDYKITFENDYEMNTFTYFNECLINALIYDPSFTSKLLDVIDILKSDGSGALRILYLLNHHILDVYYDYGDMSLFDSIIKKTFNEIKDRIDFYQNIDINLYKEFAKIVNLIYQADPSETNKELYISYLLKSIREDDGSKEFYTSLVDALYLIKDIDPVVVVPYVSRYFTFENIQECYNFVIRTMHTVSYLAKVEEIAVILKQ